MQRITTLEEFVRIRANGKGFIIITDTNGNKIHHPICYTISEGRFETKVIVNGCKNGEYYWTDRVEEAKRELELVECQKCM